jgi:hypothetical protein
MHAAQQKIVCVGCMAIFNRAGGLIAHYEFNSCPKIAKSDFLRDIERRTVVTAVLRGKPLVEENDLHSIITETAGGVQSFSNVDQLRIATSQALVMDNTSTPLKGTLSPNSLGGLDSQNWPTLNGSKKDPDSKQVGYLPPHKRLPAASSSFRLSAVGGSENPLSLQKEENIAPYQDRSNGSCPNIWQTRQESNEQSMQEEYVPPHKRQPNRVNSMPRSAMGSSSNEDAVEKEHALIGIDNHSVASLNTDITPSLTSQSTTAWKRPTSGPVQVDWDSHQKQPTAEWRVKTYQDVTSRLSEGVTLVDRIDAAIADPTTGTSGWSRFWNPLLSKYECPVPGCR